MAGADSAALSGLKAADQKMTSIGNNVSNANTDGYKKELASFSTIVAGTTNPKSFASGGVTATPLRLASEQGLLKATTSGTDVAVSGNGFFVVGKQGALAAGLTNEFSFTRAGSFLPDKQGYLGNVAGYYLQGWPTDTAGVPTVTDLNSVNQLQTVRVNQIAGITTPSTAMELKVNLPSDKPINGTERTSIEVYNSLGEANTLLYTWTKTIDSPLTWDLTVTTPNGVITQGAGAGAPYANIPVVFNGNGQPVSYGGAAAPPNIFVTWTTAANPSNLALNLGTVNTSDGISCRSGGYAETLVTQNGKGVGQLSGIQINEEGIVAALFDNGQTLNIFKIPLANFASPHQLASKDGNVWGQTDGSGGFLLAAAKSAGMGSLKSNALEQSTVELADEFTRMMETERYYSSNVKVIQTTESMFNDLKQLKR